MPTSATLRSNLRRFLDDFETDHRQGLRWEDDSLDLALTVAQYAVARLFYVKGHYHLLSFLSTRANLAVATPTAVPSDYMFAGGASVDSLSTGNAYPAAVYMGYGSRVVQPTLRRYTVEVDANNVTCYVGLSMSTGVFAYYKRPTAFSAASNHADFIDPVYDVIMYFASALLQQNDVGFVTRAMKNVQAVLTKLVGESAGVFPMVTMEDKA